jgi:hypothetical protein
MNARRHHFRIPVDVTAEVYDFEDTAWYRARVLDLSARGARLRLARAHRWTVGEEVNLLFDYDGGEEEPTTMEISGTVIRLSGETELGVEFSPLSETLQHQVDAVLYGPVWLASLQARQPELAGDLRDLVEHAPESARADRRDEESRSLQSARGHLLRAFVRSRTAPPGSEEA